MRIISGRMKLYRIKNDSDLEQAMDEIVGDGKEVHHGDIHNYEIPFDLIVTWGTTENHIITLEHT